MLLSVFPVITFNLWFYVKVCLVRSHNPRAPCPRPLNVPLDMEPTNQQGFDGVMHSDTVQPNSPSDASSPAEKLPCRLPACWVIVWLWGQLAATDSCQRRLMCPHPSTQWGRWLISSRSLTRCLEDDSRRWSPVTIAHMTHTRKEGRVMRPRPEAAVFESHNISRQLHQRCTVVSAH